jgi:hypothetical protein
VPPVETITRYVGETKPFTTQLTEPVENPISGVVTDTPLVLTGLVSQVRFMAQDVDTGAIIDHPAIIDETPGNDASIGTVHYTPMSGEVASAAEWVQWWRLIMAADGSTQDTGETLIRIRAHGIPTEGVVTPVGVCAAWATNEDVVRYAEGSGVDTDYEPWLVEASEILYALSGRRFANGCPRTVRPARTDACGCFQVLSRGHLVYPLSWEWLGGHWCAENGVTSGCGILQQVELPGYVRDVASVKLSGVTVDPATYRVDRNRYLVRVTDPATGQNAGWPLCQDLSLADDQPGTFTVTYHWGRTPPLAGVRAAALLAFQLWLADNRGNDACALPAGWTSVTRQGITVSRPAAQRVPTEGTGIVGIDSFLQTYNPTGLIQEPLVYSPDVTPLPYRVS